MPTEGVTSTCIISLVSWAYIRVSLLPLYVCNTNPVRLNVDLQRLPKAQLTFPRENFIYCLYFQSVSPVNPVARV